MKITMSKSILSIIIIFIFSIMFLGSSGSGDCLFSDGSGNTECVVCVNGKTEFMGEKQTCTFCNGNGSTTCTFCNGTGKNK